eukprot:c16482_g1_i1.p1 GENE.c16482_g1_i1~~c16482_g1_i1.p1  ORF type:complete len:593 (+),score=101.05 c16482_g1_i1:27-1805(+)
MDDPIPVPKGYDAEVWNELPREIQLELASQGAADQQVHVGLAAANTSPIATRTPDQPIPPSLKFLTYNCWFEDVAIEQRMHAIAELIATHQPVAVAMQEVTKDSFRQLYPLMTRLGYKYVRQNNGCPYFVVLWHRSANADPNPSILDFEGSIMARCVVGTTIQVPALGKIFVATTHLESFVFGKSHDHSAHRKRQLAEALRWMEHKSVESGAAWSVILGDLNWSERSDGSMKSHLGEGWVDVWPSLYPHDTGLTFDGPGNPMIRGNPVRARFDRGLVRGPTAVRAEIIGKTAIPGLKYAHPKKGELPVLPSDHYGLMFELTGPPQQSQPPASSVSDTTPSTAAKRKRSDANLLDMFGARSKRQAVSSEDGSIVASEVSSRGVSDWGEKGTGSFRGIKLGDEWLCLRSSLLVSPAAPSWEPSGTSDKVRVAGFDFDACLARTQFNSGGPSDWAPFYPHTLSTLRLLYSSGYFLVTATNESTDHISNPRLVTTAIERKTGRLSQFALALGVPLLCLCACKKDVFRKPARGMWDMLSQHLAKKYSLSIDMPHSFYVGDAAGRPRDHSDSDKKFAEAVGVKFFTETHFFEKIHPNK